MPTTRTLSRGSMVAACLLIAGGLTSVAYGSPPSAAKGGWEAALVPPMQAGWIGWCTEIITAHSSGGSCPADPKAGELLIDQGWSSSAPPPVTQGYAITSGEVSSVSFAGGPPVPTRSQPRLPFGLRAALVEIPALSLSELRLPTVALFDQAGQPLVRVPHNPFVLFSVRSIFWKRPKHPPRGVCRLSTRLSGLHAKWGSVVPHAEGREGIIGQGFLSCINTQYSFHHWPIQATLLLNGETPGAPPAALPNMKPLAGHPGILRELGTLARRVPRGWLLLTGGRDLRQRMKVLAALQATISL